RIFVIRDSSEEWNKPALDRWSEILTLPGKLQLSFLFRSSFRSIFGSFNCLANSLLVKWQQENRDITLLKERLRGYRFLGGEGEGGYEAMPLVCPVVLVTSYAGAHLYLYGNHCQIYKDQR